MSARPQAIPEGLDKHTDSTFSKGYRAPIKMLPAELLQEIFAFSASPFPEPAPILMPKPPSTRFNMTSLYISRVCSEWRSLSFATPEMWSWMTVSFPDEPCLNYVKYYLRRAGKTQGLNLSLSEFDRTQIYAFSCRKAPEEWTLAILDLWIEEVHRWRAIQFVFNKGPLLKVTNLPSKVLRGITSASIRLSSPKHKPVQLWDNLHKSPALREVQWPATFYRIPDSTTLAQLTSICVWYDFLSWTDFFKLLSSCTRLRWIRAKVVPILPDEIVSMTVVPCLETLLLPLPPSEAGSGVLLDFIDAPNLRELQMDVPHSEIGALGRFLDRSQCQLRKLTLKAEFYGSCSEADLIENIFEAAPYLTLLETFELSYNGLSTLTLSAFSPQVHCYNLTWFFEI